MIIEIQEKKMQIEIFGELPLDSGTLKKHLKVGRESQEQQFSKPFDKHGMNTD